MGLLTCLVTGFMLRLNCEYGSEVEKQDSLSGNNMNRLNGNNTRHPVSLTSDNQLARGCGRDRR